MTTFLRSYLECALWSSTDDNDQPFDDNYTIDDLAPEAIAAAERDCKAFGDDLPEYNHPQYTNEEMAGHDFWLTRNRHGDGFWGRDLENDIWTDRAHKFGETDLYLGDDGKLYFSR